MTHQESNKKEKSTRGTAMIFAIVGVIGTVPALYGLFIAIAIMAERFSAFQRGGALSEKFFVAFLIITVFGWGFSLLLQYALHIRRSRYACDPTWLWGMTCFYNALLGTVGVITVSSKPEMVMMVGMWFSGLCALSIRAFRIARQNKRRVADGRLYH